MAENNEDRPSRTMTWRWLQAYVAAVALCAAAAGYLTGSHREATSSFGFISQAAAKAPVRRVTASELGALISEEFKAIRPADLDASAPQIPPSEVWPAQ